MATRAVSTKCPNCNAALSVAETATVVTCTYCGESCRLQQRTMFLQRPVAPKVTPAQFQQALKIAQTPARYTWLFLMVSVAVTLAVVAVSVFRSMRAVNQSMSAFGGTSSTQQQQHQGKPKARAWNAGAILFGDVNGDGKDDMVGLVGASDGTDAIGGYSVETGEQLWESTPFAADTELQTWELFVVAGYAVQPLGNGELIGIALGKSGFAWRISLGEKFDKACLSDDPNLVLVQTTDKKRRMVDVRTGTVSEAPESKGKKAPDCPALFQRDQVPGALPLEDRWTGAAEPRDSGMRIAGVVQLPDGDAIVIGPRWPGTAVPTVARVNLKGKKYERRWKVETPVTDPLTASSERVAAVVGDVVITPIIDKDRNVSLTALALSDGARRWVTANLPIDSFRAMAVRDSIVFVSAVWGAAAVDIATGKVLWTTPTSPQ